MVAMEPDQHPSVPNVWPARGTQDQFQAGQVPSSWPLRPPGAATEASATRWPPHLTSTPFGIVRDPSQAKIAGVAAWLASRFQVDQLLVRTVFVLAACSGGLGLVVYLGIWLTSSTVDSPRAPLDRLFTTWRNWPARGLAAMIGLPALILAALIRLPFGLTPIIVLAITFGAAWHYQRRPTHHVFPASQAVQPHTTATSLSTATLNRSRRGTGAITLITLTLALAAGVASGLLFWSIAVGLASSLAVLGAGLLIGARRGRNRVLIVLGLLVALVAPVTAGVTRFINELPVTYDFATQGTHAMFVSDLVSADTLTLDRTRAVTVDVNAIQSLVSIYLPADRPVTVNYTEVDSDIELPGASVSGTGSWSNSVLVDPSNAQLPPLTINIEASKSILRMVAR